MPFPLFQNEAVARLKRLSRKMFIPRRLHFHSREEFTDGAVNAR